MKKVFYLLVTIFLLLLLTLNRPLPKTRPTTVPSLTTNSTAYLLPLDSRPVCTDYPVKLAKLSGTALILPPKELLDNYRQPGNTEKLLDWLRESAKTNPQNFYLSTDMLLYGGLIASRQQALSLEHHSSQLLQLKKITDSVDTHFQIFNLIPRLLVSDELIPDRWYKYRLFRYSQYYHQAMVTGEYLPALKQQEYANAIPTNILTKYQKLFTNSYQLNQHLLQHSSDKLEIIFGQDDGHPWGLSTYTAELLDLYLNRHPQLKGQITHGADEIASCLIAQNYLHRQAKSPKFYIRYADSSIPTLFMPYLAASVDAVLNDKLQLIGAQSVDDPQQADIILYVNCGHDTYLPTLKQAEELKQLITTNHNVALIDLTANFETNELLLPHLLKVKAPLNKLIAYSGWNTFSNSAGTALAQAAIIWGRKQELKQSSELLALHAYNIKILAEQILDNYYYQKEYHAKLKNNLLWRGIEPTNLNSKDKAVAEAFIRQFIRHKSQTLLQDNLGTTPFYEDSSGAYYLKTFSTSVKLPWNRIFEIDLQVQNLQIGCQYK